MEPPKRNGAFIPSVILTIMVSLIIGPLGFLAYQIILNTGRITSLEAEERFQDKRLDAIESLLREIEQRLREIERRHQ